MGLKIKNNRLQGTFKSGEQWRVKLSIQPTKEIGVFTLFASLLVNEVYQSNICERYNKGEYRNAIQTLLVNAEKEFGVELLSSDLKVAV